MSTNFEIRVDPGRVVRCDFCNDDYTDAVTQGGLLFGTYAVCPECSERIPPNGRNVKAHCPEGKSFADWVREDLR